MNDISKTKLKCPIALKWTIPENRLKELKEEVREIFYSETFDAYNLLDVEYYLSIQNHDGYIWISLHLESSNVRKIDTDFCISIESAKYSRKTQQIIEDTNGWCGYCCTIGELFHSKYNFIVNEKMTIRMDGILSIENDIPKKDEYVINQADILCLDLWKQEKDKNVVIVAEEKEITIHKCVLTTRSKFFAKMLESEKIQENKYVIEDFSYDTVAAAIKFFYHRSLVTAITVDEKMKLLQFYDKYGIQSLKDDLEAELISEINESTVCQLANCSLLSNASKLEEECAEFIHNCLKVTIPIADFDLLDKDFAMNLLKNAFYHLSK